jgi:sporulation protein YlmC with PRC-barrel domain
MKLSELLDREVVSVSGETVGYIADVRLVQDGPIVGAYAASLRLDGFIVVPRRHPRLLGYDRNVGPIYVRAAIGLLVGDALYVAWHQVQAVGDVVMVTATRDQLPRLRDLPRSRLVE